MAKKLIISRAAATQPPVDAIRDINAAPAEGYKRYRVKRPILHGKINLTAGDFVDMDPTEALHLVESQALEFFVVPTADGTVVVLEPTPSSTTNEEVSAKEAAAAVDKAQREGSGEGEEA